MEQLTYQGVKLRKVATKKKHHETISFCHTTGAKEHAGSNQEKALSLKYSKVDLRKYIFFQKWDLTMIPSQFIIRLAKLEHQGELCRYQPKK